jgi:Xaa-Pro dipeptidase
MISRRELLAAATAAGAAGAVAPGLSLATESGAALKSMTRAAQPISSAERKARLDKVQGLMQQQKVGALLVEAGATLEYFTGVRWRTSERTPP